MAGPSSIPAVPDASAQNDGALHPNTVADLDADEVDAWSHVAASISSIPAHGVRAGGEPPIGRSGEFATLKVQDLDANLGVTAKG